MIPVLFEKQNCARLRRREDVSLKVPVSKLPDISNGQTQVSNAACSVSLDENVFTFDVAMCNCWLTYKNGDQG